jgi:hypothetical protein
MRKYIVTKTRSSISALSADGKILERKLSFRESMKFIFAYVKNNKIEYVLKDKDELWFSEFEKGKTVKSFNVVKNRLVFTTNETYTLICGKILKGDVVYYNSVSQSIDLVLERNDLHGTTIDYSDCILYADRDIIVSQYEQNVKIFWLEDETFGSITITDSEYIFVERENDLLLIKVADKYSGLIIKIIDIEL